MEKDKREQEEPNEPAKHTRVRLASPRKQLERTIQKMTKVSETAMKPEKLVDLLTTLSALQVKLLDMNRDTKEAKHDALIEENERLKLELAARPTDEDIQVKLMLAKLHGSKQLAGEIETLKSHIAKLQAENAELSTINSGSKPTNSDPTEMQRLLLENAKLQLTITKLESRTTQELLDELNAKLKATSVRTS
jgi:hypothetical protein